MSTELLKLRILVAAQDLKIRFYMQNQFILVPPPISASAPSLGLLWQRHWDKAPSSRVIFVIVWKKTLTPFEIIFRLFLEAFEELNLKIELKVNYCFVTKYF